MIGYGFRHQRSVGEQCDDKPFAFGIIVDIEEVRAQQGFAARQQQPQAARFSDFWEDLLDFLQAQLFTPAIDPLWEGKIAVLAAQIAARR